MTQVWVSSRAGARLDVEEVAFAYGERPILDAICFGIEPGECVGLLGPNGSGKSTLLRCLYRYLQPSGGAIRLDGIPINTIGRQPFAQQVAVVLQQGLGPFSLTVSEFVSTGLLAQHSLWHWRMPAQDRSHIEATLNQVDLHALRDTPLEALSGGEFQRALIARALVQRPRLLLLDEPTNHLDMRYQAEILSLVKTLPMTVIVAIHDINLASAFCDRLLVLKSGQLVADGSPKQVLVRATIEDYWGLPARVNPHPFGDHPQISFDYRASS